MNPSTQHTEVISVSPPPAAVLKQKTSRAILEALIQVLLSAHYRAFSAEEGGENITHCINGCSETWRSALYSVKTWLEALGLGVPRKG